MIRNIAFFRTVCTLVILLVFAILTATNHPVPLFVKTLFITAWVFLVALSSLPTRFSLRTLFIGMALVAIVLGVVVWVVRG
jgi:hypothetical protein